MAKSINIDLGSLSLEHRGLGSFFEPIEEGTKLKIETYSSASSLSTAILFWYEGILVLKINFSQYRGRSYDLWHQWDQMLKYAFILKEIVGVPLDNLPLLVFNDRYALFSDLIKHLLENGGFKNSSPDIPITEIVLSRISNTLQ